MLRQTVKYTDFDGNPQEETLYFNLTKTELVEWQAELNGNLVGWMSGVMASGNQSEIMQAFKDLLKRTYGVKSADGKRFVKVVEGRRIADDFVETAAYDAFFLQLLEGGAEGAANFVAGIMPSGMQDASKPDVQLLRRIQDKINAGDIQGAQALMGGGEISQEKDVREVTLYNEQPVNDSTVPPLELPPEEQARIELEKMSKEELIEHFSKVGNVNPS